MGRKINRESERLATGVFSDIYYTLSNKDRVLASVVEEWLLFDNDTQWCMREQLVAEYVEYG